MRTNNVLGILFSNSYDEALPEMTSLRTMGSVPFACRYRLIDFPLSALVNAGISKVGVITKANYRSLMDHLGMGKAWDLSRKHEGLVLLPPFVGVGSGGNQTRMEGLRSAMEFLGNSKEEYVLMGDCNTVCSLDYRKLMALHMESGADITAVYARGRAPKLNSMRFALREDGFLRDVRLGDAPTPDECYALNIFVLRKALLERIIREASSTNSGDFDVIARNVGSLRVFGAEAQSYTRVIDSLQTYYDVSMELLQPAARRALFNTARPVLTKVQDDMPTIYGLRSGTSDCLVADGCQIRGQAAHSVLFRGVVIEEGARVKDCVLMQGTRVGAGVTLEHVITDKAVVIQPGKTLIGAANYPIYLGKKIVV